MHTSDLNFYRPGSQPVTAPVGFRPKPVLDRCGAGVHNSADKTGQQDSICNNHIYNDDHLCASCRKETGEDDA